MRLFVAIDISEDIRKELLPLLSLLSGYRGIKPVEPENLHITLKFLGEVNDAKAELIRDRLRQIQLEPFKIRFRGIGFFPNSNYLRVIWIGVEGDGIYSLAKDVEESMRKLGFKKDKDFKAHLTVGRVKRIGPQDKAKLLKELETYSREYGEMVVDNFRLKKSTLTPKGPIYEDVEVFGGL
ncbi:RNA 2',3'-cyclic phosphodiesterase [Geoglobus acetivorans]|uniref:RNA 2',3'-cyclic phosphodiesterase n=1 Tax=Geoglobus acetivorans TaxID=565033 RepID=A0ABZ3H3S6_GEOAI|nr:RNA 2',3'-cyclic phosphodiesterase [Geoglobus acetivorans]